MRSNNGNGTTPSYDGLGWLYDRHWRGLWPKAMAVLERIALPGLPEGARILDLGCGAGHLAAALAARGYDVTGIDISADMLRYARRNAPGVRFVCADARRFSLRGKFDLVVSTFDSMNHMLSARDLEQAFRCVRRALAPGGIFVFDLNMSRVFETEWRRSAFFIFDDHTYIVRGDYDRDARLARTELTVFRREKHWTRSDFSMFQRCYSRSEVRSALRAAGFEKACAFNAASLDMHSHLAHGRAYFRATAPERVRRALRATAAPA